MDAQVGNQDEQFVAAMAADAVEGFMFCVATVIVGIIFLPLFAYGLGVSAWDFVKVGYRRIHKYLTELSTRPRHEAQISGAGS